MPNKITWNANKYIEFVYDASGNKWRKIVTDGVTKTVYDYFGGIEYKNGNFDALYHPEGRVTKTAIGTYRYEYTIKDHLGNGRVYFTDINGDNNITDSDILQEQNYYAFGAAFDIGPWYGNSTAKSKYQYNGKEMNDDFGLNLSDYGARWYDANLGRWWNIDPLAEKSRRYSPYVYGNNNPIRFIDPDGMTADDIILRYTDKNGKTQSMKYTPGMKDKESYAEEFRHGIQGLNSIYANEKKQIDELSNAAYHNYEINVSTDTKDISVTLADVDFNGPRLINGKYTTTTIYEPFGGYVDENNNKHSPISGLYHELQHGYDRFKEAEVFHNAKSKSEKAAASKWFFERTNWGSAGTGLHGFNNNEELSPTRSEAKYQQKFLGETSRPNHRGLPYFTTWPFTTEIDKSKSQSYPKY